MRIAALDLGTNTFLCLIADVGAGGQIERVVRDEARVIRLGQGVDAAKRLHPEALSRARACFEEYGAFIRESEAERVIACATSAARDAQNREELISAGRDNGIPIQVIDGAREAELTFAGTVSGGGGQRVAVIDVGGGSTEIIFGSAGKADFRRSVDVGSVRLTERFLPRHPIPSHDWTSARGWAEGRFAEISSDLAGRAFDSAIAVAGTATTLAALDLGRPFDAASVEGHEMTAAGVGMRALSLAAMSVDERRAISGMDAKRADVIAAGALCLELACHAIGAKRISVSTRGLRYGIALKQGEFAWQN